MNLRCERLAERSLRAETEQLVEGIIGVGETAIGGTAEDGVTLCVDQSFVAYLALV